jgi:hypothetical protein
MFQFRRCPPHELWIHSWVSPLTGRWVAPFGDRRISVWFPLPDAFRSCPRPSSALDAKASTACLCSFFFLTPVVITTPTTSLCRQQSPLPCIALVRAMQGLLSRSCLVPTHHPARLPHLRASSHPTRRFKDSSCCLFCCEGAKPASLPIGKETDYQCPPGLPGSL